MTSPMLEVKFPAGNLEIRVRAGQEGVLVTWAKSKPLEPVLCAANQPGCEGVPVPSDAGWMCSECGGVPVSMGGGK